MTRARARRERLQAALHQAKVARMRCPNMHTWDTGRAQDEPPYAQGMSPRVRWAEIDCPECGARFESYTF